MGKPSSLKRYGAPDRPILADLPKGLVRRRPRRFAEWRALRAWGKLPSWELEPVGYLLRVAREGAGLTQADLARRLGCSQQAVAQAERWEGNPTVDFIRRWAEACGSRVKVKLTGSSGARLQGRSSTKDVQAGGMARQIPRS